MSKIAKAVTPAIAKVKAISAKPRTTRAPVATVAFVVQDYARPSAGRNLFAFTQAWLELTGLASGKAIFRDQLKKIAGNTAVSYHFRNGNLEQDIDGMKLTPKGKEFFEMRASYGEFDAKIVEAYKAIMTHGKADGMLIKAQDAIVKIAA